MTHRNKTLPRQGLIFYEIFIEPAAFLSNLIDDSNNAKIVYLVPIKILSANINELISSKLI